MFIDLLRRVKENINKKYLQKLIAKSMIMKIVGFSALFAVMPIEAKTSIGSSGAWDSQVRMDTTKLEVASLPENSFSVKIEPKPQPTPKPVIPQRSVAVRERFVPSRDPGSTDRRALVQAAAARYNIPWQILEAVWQVESGKSWDTSRSSYAGATGPMQFLPSTFRAYAVDGDGDGKALITDAHDAVYTAARYLAANGANRGQVLNALYRYNHSTSYVNKVLLVARSIGYVG